MNKLKWYIADKEYINYLRKFDNKVENIDYKNNLKPYIGIIININEFNYYVPISSPKEKHYKMKDDMDFIRIKQNKRILGVLNLNNMVPILDKYVKMLDYKDIEKFRTFKTDREKKLYIGLLNKELKIINLKHIAIRDNAIKLYKEKLNKPNSKLAKRCCDFEVLEEKAKLYNGFF